MFAMTMTVSKLMERLAEVQREYGGDTPVLMHHPRSTDYADASCARTDYAHRHTGPHEQQEWRVKNRHTSLDDADQAVLIIR